MNRPLRIVSVLTAVAAVAVWSYWVSASPPPLTSGPSQLPATALPTPTTLPTDLGRREAPPPVATSARELQGVVIDERGKPLTGATVIVHPSDGGGARMAPDVATTAPAMPVNVLARAMTDEAGRFRIAPREVSTTPVDVVASMPGWRRAGCQGVNPGESPPLTLVLTKGLSIEGRVVQANGTPVPGVRVVACSDPRTKPRDMVTTTTRGWLAPQDLGLHDGFVRAESTSTASGEFRIDGLPRGEMFVNTLDDRWIARTMPIVPAGARGVEVVVLPPVHVILDVATMTGVPVDSFAIVAAFRAAGATEVGTTFSFTGTAGHVEAWIGQPEPAVRAIVHVRAAGCIDHREEYEVVTDKLVARVSLDSNGNESVPLTILDHNGERATDLILHRGSPRDATLRPVDLKTIGNVPHAMLPLGLWQLQIRSQKQFPLAPALLTAVDVVSGRTPPVVGTLAGGPTLTVDLRSLVWRDKVTSIGFDSTSGTLRLRRSDITSDSLSWRSMPRGRWRLSIVAAGEDTLSKDVQVDEVDVWVAFP
jgi:hypothetical protein